jgi:hypothetical protein
VPGRDRVVAGGAAGSSTTTLRTRSFHGVPSRYGSVMSTTSLSASSHT